MEKKTHFKMYKAKTKWMVAGITTGVALLGALGVASADNVTNANSTSNANNVATPQSSSVQNNSQSSSSQSNSNVVVLKAEPVQKQNVQQNNQGTPVKKADNQQFIEYSNGQAKPIASPQTKSSVQTSTPKAAQPVKAVAQSSSNVQQNQSTQTNNYTQQLNQYQSSQKQTRNDSANAPITDTLPQAQDNAHDDVYHMQTTQGWSNDVQTIVIGNDGQTHYYFLHSVDGATNPFGPSGQDWESVDTYETWSNNGQGDPNPNEYKNPHIALNSHGTSNPDSWKSAWTGSVIQNRGDIQGVPQGDEVAYFAGLNKSDGSQNIYAAWSDDDGETFTHALNNGAPVLAWNQAGASGKQDQERDSYVTYDENGKLLMYTAEGNQLGVYTSTNGINWVPSGKVGPDQFFKGLNWDDKQNMPIECPQLANLKDENDNSHVVLFYGCKDPQNGQTTGTYYVVGHLDSKDDFVADFPAHRLDQGSDYYGANIQQNTLDNPIDGVDGIGWIGNWNYTSAGVYDNQDSQGKMTPHLGSYSLPRVYSLNSDGTLSTALQHVYTTPTYATGNDDISIDNPIIGIKTEDHSIQVDTDNGQPVYKMYQSNIDGSASHYKFDFSDVNNYNGRVYIKISQGKDYVILNYDPRNGMYRVSRYSSELNNDMQKTVASSYYYDGALGNGLGYSADDGALNNDSTSENTLQDFTIEIYTDQDSIEFVMPNGHVYTCARYGTDKLQRIEVDTSDKNSQLDYDYTTYNGPKYELKDGEETNMGEPGNNTSVVNPKADNSATDNPVMQPTDSSSGNSSNSGSSTTTTPSTDKPSNGSSSSSSSTTNSSKPDSSTSSSNSNKPSDTTNTQPSDSTSTPSNKPSSTTVNGKVIASYNDYQWIENNDNNQNNITLIHQADGKAQTLSTYKNVTNIKTNDDGHIISFNFNNNDVYSSAQVENDSKDIVVSNIETEQSIVKDAQQAHETSANTFIGDGKPYNPSSPVSENTVWINGLNGNKPVVKMDFANGAVDTYHYDSKTGKVTVQGLASPSECNVQTTVKNYNGNSVTYQNASTDKSTTIDNNWLYSDSNQSDTDNKPANSSSSSSNSTTNNSKPNSSTSSSNSNKPSDTTNTKPTDSTSTKPSDKPSQSTTNDKPSSSTTGQTSSSSSSSSTTTDHSSQPANNPNDVNHDVNGGSSTNSSKPSSSTSSTTNTQKPDSSSSNSSSSTTDSSSSTSTGNQLPDSTSAEDHSSSNHETDETGNGSETPNSSTSSASSDSSNQDNGSSSESSNSTSSTSESSDGTTSTTTNNTSSSNASSTTTNSSSSQNSSSDVDSSQNSSNDSSAKTSENSVKKEGSVTTQSTKAVAEKGTAKKNGQESSATADSSSQKGLENTTANVASNDAQSSVTAQGSDNSKQENSQKLPQTGENNNQELVEIGLEMFGVIATAGVAINKKRYGTK